ncbi:MAG: TSUP family transporter [Caloramator sp.]|nr:TSUP family transporter [Caloramator sp.]
MVTKIIFLCIAGFVAAFVDSIAGGGGIISLPAYLFAGVPPHFALGTNKFSSTVAAFTSSIKFAKSQKIDFNLIKYIAPFTLIGAAIGVNTVVKINQKYLYFLVFILLFIVGIYSLFSKTVGEEDDFRGFTKKNILLGILLAFSIGFYDGFFGPGTGSFLMFGLIRIYGFDFVKGAGNARFLNFISNIISLFMFAFYGRINYVFGIPVAISMIIGARLGTVIALKQGAKIIKPIFICMSLAVALKMMLNIMK